MKQRKRWIPSEVDRLYKSVENFVVERGGSVLVIGGIEIQAWPNDTENVYHIAVKCLGRRPELEPVTKRHRPRKAKGAKT